MSFANKVALVTGGSSGIGADVARHLAEQGAKVAIVGRNEKRLTAVSDLIKGFSSLAPLVVVADVTKDAERIVDETIKHFGKLDILINSAGAVTLDSADTVELSEFDRIFDSNVRSVVHLTKLCVPHLEKTKGNIVNVSSASGKKPHRNYLSYCMSKAALDQFTKCSALDLAPKGIRVNSINPGLTKTNFFESLGVSAGQFQEKLKLVVKQFPIGRVGEVADTTAAIAYLADNNQSSFITGILLPVDGGVSL